MLWGLCVLSLVSEGFCKRQVLSHCCLERHESDVSGTPTGLLPLSFWVSFWLSFWILLSEPSDLGMAMGATLSVHL